MRVAVRPTLPIRRDRGVSVRVCAAASAAPMPVSESMAKAAAVAGSHAHARGLERKSPLGRLGEFMREQSAAGKEMLGNLGVQVRWIGRTDGRRPGFWSWSVVFLSRGGSSASSTRAACEYLTRRECLRVARVSVSTRGMPP